METVDQYVKIMIESLQKKIDILDQIIECSEFLSKLVSETEMDMEQFREQIDRRDGYVNQINQMDEGFQNLFDKVREELQADKSPYKDDILTMQQLIRDITDRTVQIQETEARNRLAIDGQFHKMRQDIRSSRQGMQVAQNYYKNMSKLNVVDSHFTDQRK